VKPPLRVYSMQLAQAKPLAGGMRISSKKRRHGFRVLVSGQIIFCGISLNPVRF
jgi:hypothetical protein